MPEPASSPFVEREQQRDAARVVMWTFLATEVMFFGALFTTYFYDRSLFPAGFASAGARTDWGLGAGNTAVLLISSLFMALAVEAAKEGRHREVARHLLVTIALGAAFLVLKGVEYADHIRDGLLPGASFHYDPAGLARQAELFFYLYFTMTGLHALHMIGGIVWLSLLIRRSRRGGDMFTVVEVAGLYWHFVDMVWIFLFPMFYLVGRH